MSYGYSARIVAANQRQDESCLGVKLGRVCIALDIPVVVIAKQVGVSKQTIYNWFMGAYEPHASCKATVESLLRNLETKKQ